MADQIIVYVNIIYTISFSILRILNQISLYQYFQIQRIYFMLQCLINRDQLIYHLATILFICSYLNKEPSLYVIISISLFQLIIMIVQFAEDPKFSRTMSLRIAILISILTIVHISYVFFKWQQYSLIENGFNIYIWIYVLVQFLRTISINIRFDDGRAFLLSLLCMKNGCKAMTVTDLTVARQVLLNSSDKGSCIEEKIATPAWSPVLSLESVNGSLWEDLKSRFLIFQKHLLPIEELAQITRKIVSSQDLNIDIDAKQVVRITLACFIKWLFNLDWNPQWEFVCEASWEWRKEIAVKGKANTSIKSQTVNWMIDLINQSKYYELFGEEWSKPEYYSIILQPFILSPMINMSDIAVSTSKHPELSINELIHYYHPFPILERYISQDLIINTNDNSSILIKANTQVFIPLDRIGQSQRYDNQKWSPFGVGPRKCLGNQYAIIFLTEFIAHLKNHPKFVPEKRHKYSGRNNDDLTFSESMYQFIVFAKLLLLR